MKKFLLFIGVLFVFWACSTQKGVIKVEQTNSNVAQKDSVEYDLETFDSKFKAWYGTNNKPSMYKTQEYYEYWNRQYVLAWNAHTGEKNSTFFESIVGYNPKVDYGLELNHKLFYYFQYVENVLKIKIMSGSPKAIQF